MFDLRKIPMLRVLLPFFGGVYAGIHPDSGFELSRVLIILPLLTLAVFVVFNRQKGKAPALPWLNPVLLFLVFFLVGVGTAIVVRPGDPGLPEDRWVLVRGQLCGSAFPGRYGYVFDMKVMQICSADSIYQVRTQFKCYMSEPPDSLLPAPGETWQFCGRLAGIQNSRNPGMPDFRAIMGRRNCWYRFYISSSHITLRYNREVEWDERKLASAHIRRQMSEHWQGGAEELSLLRAVCLGDRSLLSDDLRQAYTNAGGMHLLAVSGLHVGLIWWVL
jgi:competence protein ComEC